MNRHRNRCLLAEHIFQNRSSPIRADSFLLDNIPSREVCSLHVRNSQNYVDNILRHLIRFISNLDITFEVTSAEAIEMS